MDDSDSVLLSEQDAPSSFSVGVVLCPIKHFGSLFRDRNALHKEFSLPIQF